jgi:pentose-5-phosphate-3-epimerase
MDFIKKVNEQQNCCIAIDFDGVIHKNSKGYHDGTVYDKPIYGTLKALKLISQHYKIIIYSCKALPDRPLLNGKTGIELIWDWLKSYNLDSYIHEVTSSKPRAAFYIDDKNIEFTNWNQTLNKLFNNDIKISASVIGSQNLLKDLFTYNLFDIDYLHIDWFSETDITDELNLISNFSCIPMDFHVIGCNDLVEETVLKYKPDSFCYQYNKNDLSNIITSTKKIKSEGINVGISLCLDDDFSFLKKHDFFDFIMIMNTTPGVSGQKLDINKSKNYLNQILSKHEKFKIRIDGGIDKDSILDYKDYKVDVFVSGSYISGKNQFLNILNLHGKQKYLSRKINKYVKKSQFVILDYNDLSLDIVVNALNKYQTGFVVVKKNEFLYGVITDGDIRRKINQTFTLDDLINKNPVYCFLNSTVEDFFNTIQEKKCLINFIPVVNKNKILVGLIDTKQVINNYAK